MGWQAVRAHLPHLHRAGRLWCLDLLLHLRVKAVCMGVGVRLHHAGRLWCLALLLLLRVKAACMGVAGVEGLTRHHPPSLRWQRRVRVARHCLRSSRAVHEAA